MNWIALFSPLLGVLLGWGLSQWGKVLSDKRTDKRKLKRLLFYILELRFHFTSEIHLQNKIDTFIEKAKEQLTYEFGLDAQISISMIKPIITEILEENSEESKIIYLEDNIDEVLIDLSEVFPIFAYELSGQHRIKQRLKDSEKYLRKVEAYTNELPFDAKSFVQPKISNEFLSDLDNNLINIASRIDRKTTSDVIKKIEKMDSQDNSDMNEELKELIDKIKQNNNTGL